MSNYQRLTPKSVDSLIKQALLNSVGKADSPYYLLHWYNPHLSPNVVNRLIRDAQRSIPIPASSWPDDAPVFHTYSPAKGQGFYAQLKKFQQGGVDVGNVYIHQVGALQNAFWADEEIAATEGRAVASTGEDIVKLWNISDPQASHVFQGFPSAARDMNPKNLRLESGIVNRSRWFCCLRLAAQLRAVFKHLTATASQLAVEVIAPSQISQQDEPDEDDSLPHPEAAAAVLFTNQSLADEPELFAAAVASLQPACSDVHSPCCKFWNYSKLGEIPVQSMLCGDSRKLLGTHDKRVAALASLQQQVENVIATYAATVFTPPLSKAAKTAMGQSPRAVSGSAVPKQLQIGSEDQQG